MPEEDLVKFVATMILKTLKKVIIRFNKRKSRRYSVKTNCFFMHN